MMCVQVYCKSLESARHEKKQNVDNNHRVKCNPAKKCNLGTVVVLGLCLYDQNAMLNLM